MLVSHLTICCSNFIVVSDFLFKFLFLGECGSGKTSLLDRFVDNTFSDALMCTISADLVRLHSLLRDLLLHLLFAFPFQKISENSNSGTRRENYQVANVGHQRWRALSHNHAKLLSWSACCSAGLRYFQLGILSPHQTMAA